MPKAVSLYMPHWSTDLILRSSRKRTLAPADRREPVNRPPVLLYAQSAGRQLVARCCAAATAAGVRAGMTVAHARALLPVEQAVVELHQPQRELAALGALARWALRFSPIVAVDPPDGLLIDIAGCRRLFGDASRHVHLIGSATERLGFCARVAAAPTFACARAVARFGSGGGGGKSGGESGGLVAEGGQRRALAPLPVEALGVEAASVDALREVGIDRIGHLFDLPRSSLAARFGRELLRRLDQAVGRAPETIDPVRPVAPPVVERVRRPAARAASRPSRCRAAVGDDHPQPPQPRRQASLVATGAEDRVDQPRLGRGASASGRLGPGPACP
ncbi:MAG: Y-family DNA polymerase [Planctomycetota bacterium]